MHQFVKWPIGNFKVKFYSLVLLCFWWQNVFETFFFLLATFSVERLNQRLVTCKTDMVYCYAGFFFLMKTLKLLYCRGAFFFSSIVRFTGSSISKQTTSASEQTCKIQALRGSSFPMICVHCPSIHFSSVLSCVKITTLSKWYLKATEYPAWFDHKFERCWLREIEMCCSVRTIGFPG